MNPDYLKEVAIWYGELMPRLQPYLYGNGGPIILVQIENEYGAFECDNQHSVWLRDETKKYTGDEAILFTNDIIHDKDLKCGKIENVLATVDFGSGKYKHLIIIRLEDNSIIDISITDTVYFNQAINQSSTVIGNY